MTTFTGLAGGTGFLGSGLIATGGGGGGAAATVLATMGAAAGLVGAWGCAFAAGRVLGFETGVEAVGCLAMGLDVLDTAGFFVGRGTDFLAATAGATFLAAGLAILLAAGAFFTDLLLPDEWADVEAAFLAGAIFLTFTVFLAGFAAFFLVAIQLGFFSDEHF